MKKQAFVLRISPGRIDRVPEDLADNQIIIGWAEAKGLLNEGLSWEEFRAIVGRTYYAKEDNLRRAGSAAGHMWRFIREMNIGDLVVVPYGSEFYVAEVSGPATYDESKVEDDTAYRRNVNWLNDQEPIRRAVARSALISRMKTQGTCAYASDLLPQINECIAIARTDSVPVFQSDLQSRLIRETLDEMRSGHIDSFGFEKLIHDVLLGLGADEVRVVPRIQDKGADIIATFRVAGAFRLTLAVQAKHWQSEPPVGKEVVEQLIRGIEAESANLGMIVTSGTVSDDAVFLAEQFCEDKGIKIELVDGEQFAKLIVEHGIQSS